MAEPTLCLNCANFPCTCGEQYKNLSKYDLLNLMQELEQIGKEKYNLDSLNVTLNNLPIIFELRDIPKTQTTLFDAKEVEGLPKSWIDFLNSHESDSLEDKVKMLCDVSSDDIVFPSGLIMAILIKSRLTERAIANTIKDWLVSNHDDVSRVLQGFIDPHASYLKSSINELELTVEGWKADKTRHGTLNRMLLNAAIALRIVLEEIRQKDVIRVANYFSLLMACIVGDISITPQLEEHLRQNNVTNAFDYTIYYTDENFRKYIRKQKLRLPNFKSF